MKPVATTTCPPEAQRELARARELSRKGEHKEADRAYARAAELWRANPTPQVLAYSTGRGIVPATEVRSGNGRAAPLRRSSATRNPAALRRELDERRGKQEQSRAPRNILEAAFRGSRARDSALRANCADLEERLRARRN